MLVVADSSPIVALVNIDLFPLLHTLFEEVAIPPAVARELASPLRPAAVRDTVAHPPEWLKVITPQNVEPIPRIHQGEVQAISLARELAADLLLIDDREGRRAAMSRNVKTARTIAVLEEAAEKDLIDLEEAFRRLRRTDFRVSDELIRQVLARHKRRRGG